MFTEKCYNSVVSTEFLSEKNTFVTGTLRKDRKGNPKEVTGGKHKKGEMWWFEERKKMLPFVNGNTSVMLLRFGMHRHNKLLPLLIALEKKNRSPTLWETTRIQCLKLNKVNRCCPTTQGYEKLWGGTKSRSTHSWNFHYQCILPLPKCLSHPELCHLVEFDEVFNKNLIGERKKADQWHQWPTSITLKPFLTVKRTRNQGDVSGIAGRKWMLRWSTTLSDWPCFRLYHRDLGILQYL